MKERCRPGFYDYRNRALQGAFWKGWRARRDGEPITACPYQDKRDYRGSVTFSRAFIRAWEYGWSAITAARPEGWQPAGQPGGYDKDHSGDA